MLAQPELFLLGWRWYRRSPRGEPEPRVGESMIVNLSGLSGHQGVEKTP